MPGLDKMREAKSSEQPTAAAQSDGFATAADFMNRFKTSTYTFDEGLTVEFRAMTPADDQTLRGSALDGKMTEAGLTAFDNKSKQKFLDGLSSAARIEVVLEGAKVVIIQASTNPKFTGLPPHSCPPGKVSIETLTPNEILDWAAVIKKFSGGDEDEETFREPSETDAEDTGEPDAAGEDEHVDGGIDGEGVPSEPV